ncbi:MAG: cobalamin-binding protein [Xanthomonadales bacterium]|nr:cobalamin-binding protein [Gammaproteobacteria bacterium]MBT8054268.1 cobalamin-binding protein [Gammaproteobacteria bacterium]NND57539.1 cobalamin-binding protein [Xanthomonadales bacterium]NNK51263.1 cobalamin-binding protein [Xanthomonadales bacterium]
MTLSPHLSELAFAAGAGERLIATVEFSDFPPPAREVPRIGDAFRLDVERIATLSPDLVIAWDSGNPRAAVEQLRSLGINVWSVEIRSPAEIADVLELVGKAAGSAGTAKTRAELVRRRLDHLKRQYRNVITLDYFYQVGARPLFTLNGSHLVSQGLRLCGGNNVFDQEPGLAFQVSYESVIVANPDALFAPYSKGGENPLSTWREWPAMRAVRNDALFLLPADGISQATPRFLDSLEIACKLLHQLRKRRNDEQPSD